MSEANNIKVKSSQDAGPGTDGEPKAKISKIVYFFISKKKSLGEVVSRLIVSDGLNFHYIANSSTIEELLKRDGYNLPKHIQMFVGSL